MGSSNIDNLKEYRNSDKGIKDIDQLEPYDHSFDSNLDVSLIGESISLCVGNDICMPSYGPLEHPTSDLERGLSASSRSSHADSSDSGNDLERARKIEYSACLANRSDQPPNIETNLPSTLRRCSAQIILDCPGQPTYQSCTTKGQDAGADAILLSIRSASFAMREIVYKMAQSKASSTKGVMVIFGAERFQEWRQILVGNLSYIAVDPMIDVTGLSEKLTGYSIQPYDFSTTFHSQVTSLSKQGSTVLWAKCKSEDFIARTRPIQTMAQQGIPAVFSFSVSYHIPIIKTLVPSGVRVFGCGYVHDAMPLCGVGCGPVVMRPAPRSGDSIREVVSIFGEATYREPFLGRETVPGLFLVRDVMPSVWKAVDSSTEAIMERAVVLCA